MVTEYPKATFVKVPLLFRMLRLTDLKVYQKISLKDLSQVLYIDFIASIWNKDFQIFIHSLLLYVCAARFIHLLGRRSKVECYALPGSAWVLIGNTVEKAGPAGLQPSVAWKPSLEEKAFYKDSVFWGDTTENKLYSWEVLTSVSFLSGLQ